MLVDFSAPGRARRPASTARSRPAIPILVGTTGLDDLADERIAEAAKHIAVLRAANTSLGVALLADLVERAARVLGPDWDIEIVEMHHRDEGRRAVGHRAAARRSGGARARHGAERRARPRRHRPQAREPGAIGFASLRGGTVAGDHDVMFLGPDERLILSHRAESRMIFARGALAAARFLVGKPAGLYSMRDVIDAL